MQKLVGKVALITGSDSGIGQASAIEMAKEGADIVICYHTDKEGAEKYNERGHAVKQESNCCTGRCG